MYGFLDGIYVADDVSYSSFRHVYGVFVALLLILLLLVVAEDTLRQVLQRLLGLLEKHDVCW